MDGLKYPLLPKRTDEPAVSGYANAGLLNKSIFAWLDPLLKLGSSRILQDDDVPALAPPERAQELYERTNTNWEKQERKRHSLRNAIFKSFWKPLLETAVLALIKSSVAYVGPVLIGSFMAVTSGHERFPYERYILVLILVVAKVLEATVNHQFNFQTQKLGLQMRSAVMSLVFRKSLRLSSSARDRHGPGQIVNLISVDAQTLLDGCINLHYGWSAPLQLLLAGLIVYPLLGGLPSLIGLVIWILAASMFYKAVTLFSAVRKRMVKERDKRVQAIVESLANMKIIKLQAWDTMFYKRIADARDVEYHHLWNQWVPVISAQLISSITPVLCPVAVFASAVLMGRNILVSVAFTIIAISASFREVFKQIPLFVSAVSQCSISLDRLENFLWSDEIESDPVIRLPKGESDISLNVEDGSFKWEVDSDAPILQDINLNINQGWLVVVVGKVGAGKSSLLSALQGEMPKISGKVLTMGTTGCVPQTPWIQNASIQENILFGQPLEKERYELTLERCALLPDLAQLDFGDMTEIGERGVNLSGGQKQRIQLARALYQDCDIYFLDDIFSSVDAHTGSHLFEECVIKALGEKTVVLVTHQIEILPKADLILVLRDGMIVQSGKYQELLQEGSDLEALVIAHKEALKKVDTREEDGHLEIQNCHNSVKTVSTSTTGKPSVSAAGPPRKGSDAIARTQKGCLVQDEEREKGGVRFDLYWMYITRVRSGIPVLCLLIVITVGQIVQIAQNYWVALGAGYEEGNKSQALRFIYIYGALSLAAAFFRLARPIVSALVGLLTAQSYFDGFLKSIFSAPMSFFDSTPNGRILSRTTTDQAALDFEIPLLAGIVLSYIVTVAGCLVLTSVIVKESLIAVFPLCWYICITQVYYLRSSRELTRMDGLTRAPIIHHLSETTAGCSTVRCFQQQERFIATNVERIDANLKMSFHNIAAKEWCGVRMELSGCVFTCVMALLLVVAPAGVIAPEQAGLAFSYTLNLNLAFFSLVWFASSMENNMISVERLRQFSVLPTEAATESTTQLSPDWPVIGSILLEDFKLRYRPNTPLVLKGISVSIEGGEKVGLVGRTGSGKSTLILALFRLIEGAGGRILIDDVNISTVALHDLRSRLSIIPQDPTLFEGTIRNNLDPLEQHTELEMWQVLEKCQLATLVGQLEGKLDTLVRFNGQNWSAGQRQLFCIGRVLLKKTRILFLDEATSSIDTETDIVIQKILRQDFRDCTVISIAHRIPSVMDSDKVLVLNEGVAQEYDSPAALLEQPHSLFSSLLAEYSARIGALK